MNPSLSFSHLQKMVKKKKLIICTRANAVRSMYEIVCFLFLFLRNSLCIAEIVE